MFDPANPVVALCAAGMQVEGEPAKARALFEQAWAARTDDFEASIAAHFVARQQPTTEDTLRWNEIALQHADALADHRLATLLPSLCLNLGDSYLRVGRVQDARVLADRARVAVTALPSDGYGQMIAGGIGRLVDRIAVAERVAENT